MPKVSIETLSPFEGNAKRGDLPKIKRSLERLGQYKPIVVNVGTHTGRPNEILAGNNTYAAAKELGWAEIDVHLIDVPQDEAVQINLLDNRLSELGVYDKDALAKQLSDLTDFEITGYDAADLDGLLRETAANAESFIAQMSRGMQAPQFSSQQAPPVTPASAPAPQADPFAAERPVGGPEAAPAPATPPDAGQAVQQAPTAPVDTTVYFTISYTVTAEQREVIQSAIRAVQGENMEARPTSPEALTTICGRLLAGRA